MGREAGVVTLSVLVASQGRASLSRTVASVTRQLLAGDELIVDVNDDAPWGHAARNRMMPRARGDFLMFMDDDDVYELYALARVRAAIASDRSRVHVFRMMYADGHTLWTDTEVREGNVSTQMVVVPASTPGRWGDRYEGDFDFIQGSCAAFGDPVWHRDVIALIRPS